MGAPAEAVGSVKAASKAATSILARAVTIEEGRS